MAVSIARWHKRERLDLTVEFLTPAFLGNAEQSGQWRTPPFKALIRQWWRVVCAADHNFPVNPAEMRREEGLLFGHAWLDDDHNGHGQKVSARKSQVRIRLDRWEKGQLTSWDRLEQSVVPHPEVQRTKYKVGPHAYLGYGPLDGRGNTKLSSRVNAAIQAGESANLSIAVPDQHAAHIKRALALLHRYGTIGGRSRNGWGSFALHPLPTREGGAEGTLLVGDAPLRPWRDALAVDWPHAIGADDKGALIWQTAKAYDDWKTLMRDLAIVKIGLRTQFKFPNTQPPHNTPLDRHWLSYPITTHTVAEWKRKNLRLPNSLRFKVRRTNDGKCVGVIFHVPCLPPPEFRPDSRAIGSVWQRVHAFLDAPDQQLTRIPE